MSKWDSGIDKSERGAETHAQLIDNLFGEATALIWGIYHLQSIPGKKHMAKSLQKCAGATNAKKLCGLREASLMNQTKKVMKVESMDITPIKGIWDVMMEVFPPQGWPMDITDDQYTTVAAAAKLLNAPVAELFETGSDRVADVLQRNMPEVMNSTYKSIVSEEEYAARQGAQPVEPPTVPGPPPAAESPSLAAVPESFTPPPSAESPALAAVPESFTPPPSAESPALAAVPESFTPPVPEPPQAPAEPGILSRFGNAIAGLVNFVSTSTKEALEPVIEEHKEDVVEAKEVVIEAEKIEEVAKDEAKTAADEADTARADAENAERLASEEQAKVAEREKAEAAAREERIRLEKEAAAEAALNQRAAEAFAAETERVNREAAEAKKKKDEEIAAAEKVRQEAEAEAKKEKDEEIAAAEAEAKKKKDEEKAAEELEAAKADAQKKKDEEFAAAKKAEEETIAKAKADEKKAKEEVAAAIIKRAIIAAKRKRLAREKAELKAKEVAEAAKKEQEALAERLQQEAEAREAAERAAAAAREAENKAREEAEAARTAALAEAVRVVAEQKVEDAKAVVATDQVIAEAVQKVADGTPPAAAVENATPKIAAISKSAKKKKSEIIKGLKDQVQTLREQVETLTRLPPAVTPSPPPTPSMGATPGRDNLIPGSRAFFPATLPSEPTSPVVVPEQPPTPALPESPVAAAAAAAAGGTTHAPFLDNEPAVPEDEAGRHIPSNTTKAEMLGTACVYGSKEGQPEGCFSDASHNVKCESAGDAARGICRLASVAVPTETPLGLKDSRFKVYRGLDRGTQIKLQLHRAKLHYRNAARLFTTCNPRAYDRHFNIIKNPKFRGTATDVPPHIDVESHAAKLIADPINFIAEWDNAIIGDSSKAWGAFVAPEYTAPIHGPDAKGHFLNVHADGKARPKPMYKDEEGKKLGRCINKAERLLALAIQHLYNALVLYVYTNYKASLCNNTIPLGAYAFMTPKEVNVFGLMMVMIARHDARFFSRQPNTKWEHHTYIEFLRVLVAHKEDTAEQYKNVVGDVDAAINSIVRRKAEFNAVLGTALRPEGLARSVYNDDGTTFEKATK